MRSSRNFKYVKANSLVESVIAIAIISICILVAFLIYLNVIKQNKSVHYYSAKHQVESLFNAALMSNDFDDDTFKHKYYTIEKTVTISEEEHVARFNFKIKTANKTNTIRKLINLNTDEKD